MELFYQGQGPPRTVASPSFDSSSLLLFAIFQGHYYIQTETNHPDLDRPNLQWDALWVASGVEHRSFALRATTVSSLIGNPVPIPSIRADISKSIPQEMVINLLKLGHFLQVQVLSFHFSSFPLIPKHLMLGNRAWFLYLHSCSDH